jgi:hypothetical protein
MMRNMGRRLAGVPLILSCCLGAALCACRERAQETSRKVAASDTVADSRRRDHAAVRPLALAEPDAFQARAARAESFDQGLPLRLVVPPGPADRTAPPGRDPGPAQPETADEVLKVAQQAQRWTRDFAQTGLARREIAALADTYGFRYFRRRYFRRADLWFRVAIEADPSYEPALYNGTRSAALCGDVARARQNLVRLSRLGTPMARRRLDLAASDPDLQALRTKRER